MASVQLCVFLEVKMQMHEGAQMAAFIYSKGNRRLRSVFWNAVLNSSQGTGRKGLRRRRQDVPLQSNLLVIAACTAEMEHSSTCRDQPVANRMEGHKPISVSSAKPKVSNVTRLKSTPCLKRHVLSSLRKLTRDSRRRQGWGYNAGSKQERRLKSIKDEENTDEDVDTSSSKPIKTSCLSKKDAKKSVTKRSTKEKDKGKTEPAKAGYLVYIVSSSEDDQVAGDNEDLVEMLKTVMISYSALLIEHIDTSKACRVLSYLDAGRDDKAKDAVKTIRFMCVKKRIAELIKANDDLVDVVHDKGYGRIFDSVVIDPVVKNG